MKVSLSSYRWTTSWWLLSISIIDKNNVARYYMAISPDDFIFDDKKPEIEAPADTGAYAVVEDDDDPFAE